MNNELTDLQISEEELVMFEVCRVLMPDLTIEQVVARMSRHGQRDDYLNKSFSERIKLRRVK